MSTDLYQSLHNVYRKIFLCAQCLIMDRIVKCLEQTVTITVVEATNVTVVEATETVLEATTETVVDATTITLVDATHLYNQPKF